MECYRVRGDALEQEKSIWGALDADPRVYPLIAVVGGGGKTTLLYALMREAGKMGLRVLLTTTTHMELPPARLWAKSREEARALLEHGGAAVFALPCEEGKCGPPHLSPEECLALADLVLVEADGARHLPLKAPAPHEPVLPKEPSLVIGVAGLDSVGRPLQGVCHRPERVAALLEKRREELVTPQDLARLLSHPAGQKKGVRGEYRAVLNKADDPQALLFAKEAAMELEAQGVPGAILHFEKEERGTCWY